MQWATTRFGTDLTWAVEDNRSVTGLLERELLAAGLWRVVRCRPHLMARSRVSARERGKSDPIDALAVARAVLREPNLPVAFHDPVSSELRLLVDRREDLVGQRVGVMNCMPFRQQANQYRHPPHRRGPIATRLCRSGSGLAQALLNAACAIIETPNSAVHRGEPNRVTV